jgi:hypothetical protein
MSAHHVQEVRLRLMRPNDMFEMPQTDLFSEYRNFLTGMELCLSQLRAKLSRRPVRLVIELPPAEITDELPDRFGATLRRYCDHRLRYTTTERRALRIGGVTAMRIGIPLAVLGLAITWWANAGENHGEPTIVADHLGWVLGWLGLWYPLDQLLFYPLAYGREQRALRRLQAAEVVIEPYHHAPLVAPPVSA